MLVDVLVCLKKIKSKSIVLNLIRVELETKLTFLKCPQPNANDLIGL